MPELFLIRHAIAEDGPDDDLRALTPKGMKRFASVVDALDAWGVRFDQVLHSPKLRAIQTARLLLPLLDGRLGVTDTLAQPPSPKLLKLVRGERVALVGHEPHLSTLLAWLVLNRPTEGPKFELKKGSVVVLSGPLSPGELTVRAVVPPGLLRRAR